MNAKLKHPAPLFPAHELSQQRTDSTAPQDTDIAITNLFNNNTLRLLSYCCVL